MLIAIAAWAKTLIMIVDCSVGTWVMATLQPSLVTIIVANFRLTFVETWSVAHPPRSGQMATLMPTPLAFQLMALPKSWATLSVMLKVPSYSHAHPQCSTRNSQLSNWSLETKGINKMKTKRSKRFENGKKEKWKRIPVPYHRVSWTWAHEKHNHVDRCTRLQSKD